MVKKASKSLDLRDGGVPIPEVASRGSCPGALRGWMHQIMLVKGDR